MKADAKNALLDPFILAAFVYTPVGMGMIRKPAAAWTIALVGVTLYSLVAPLLMSLSRQWLRRLNRTNMAVITFWAATLLLARLLAPYPAESSPPFLLGGMAYVYALVLSAVLHIIFPVINRVLPSRSGKTLGSTDKDNSGNGS